MWVKTVLAHRTPITLQLGNIHTKNSALANFKRKIPQLYRHPSTKIKVPINNKGCSKFSQSKTMNNWKSIKTATQKKLQHNSFNSNLIFLSNVAKVNLNYSIHALVISQAIVLALSYEQYYRHKKSRGKKKKIY